MLTKLVRVLAALLAANGGRQPKSKQQHEQVGPHKQVAEIPARGMGGTRCSVRDWRAASTQMIAIDRQPQL